MYTSDQVKMFSKEFGHRPFYSIIETNELAALLNFGEVLLAIAEGTLKSAHKKLKLAGYGIIFVTNVRIVFFRISLMGEVTTIEFPIEQIQRVVSESHLFHCSLILTTVSGLTEINQLPKRLGGKVLKVISSLLDSGEPKPNSYLYEANLADQLQRLVDMRNQGIFTNAEFEKEKNDVLNKKMVNSTSQPVRRT